MLLQTKEEKCYGMQEKVKTIQMRQKPNPKSQKKKKTLKDDRLKPMLCVHHCKIKFMCVDENKITWRVTHGSNSVRAQCKLV